MPSEKSIEKAVAKYAKEKGCYVRKFKAPNNRGVPDKLFITPQGVSFFIEFKKPGGTLSALQIDEINQIKKRKAYVFVVDCTTQGKQLIDSMLLI